MSKYTTEVRFICESEAGLTESVGFSQVDEVIASALPKVFDFDFPIFDEDYRETLESKILKHYYTREIGLETYGLWKLKLATRLNEIMPYYNKLYESELYKYNPLYDVNMTTTNSGTRTGVNTQANTSSNIKDNSFSTAAEESTTDVESTNSTTSGNRNIENKGAESNASTSKNTASRDDMRVDAYSDTPQGTLTNVLNKQYLTNAREITDTEGTTEEGQRSGVSSSESTQDETNSQSMQSDRSNANKKEHNRTDIAHERLNNNSTTAGATKNTENYVVRVMGKAAGSNYARMIKDFRDNLLNIDMDIIRELNDLFMLVW